MTVPFRKRIRLDRELYAEAGCVWFSTTDTRNRIPAFRDPWLADFSVITMVDQAPKRGVHLLLYCVMPEHVHVMAEVEEGDLIGYILKEKESG